MARSDEQTNVRLPKDLKDWLLASANAQRRSLTNEIVIRLQESRAREAAAAKKVKP